MLLELPVEQTLSHCGAQTKESMFQEGLIVVEAYGPSALGQKERPANPQNKTNLTYSKVSTGDR